MITAAAARLRALSPLRLTLCVVIAFVLVSGSTAVAQSLITGSDIKDRSVEGRDIAESTVTHANIRNGSVLSQDIRDGHVLSRDVRDGTIKATDLSADVRSRLSGGASGGDGAQGTAGKDGPTGATGPQGGAGAVGAPGAFLVRDANGTTAGPLLILTTVVSVTPTMTFFFAGHAFVANATSGALALPVADFRYTQPNCAGTKYTQPYNTSQTAIRSGNTGDTNIYVVAGSPSTRVIQSGESGSTCNNFSFATPLVELAVLPTAETPAPLTGPLSFVPAG